MIVCMHMCVCVCAHEYLCVHERESVCVFVCTPVFAVSGKIFLTKLNLPALLEFVY